jgi:hypothetical protein
MMKVFLLLTLSLIFVSFTNCQSSTTPNSNTNSPPVVGSFDDLKLMPDRFNDKFEKISSTGEMVWIGEMSVSDIKTNSDNKDGYLEYFHLLTKSSNDKFKININVDILGCSGYLFSGIVQKYVPTGGYDTAWRLKIIKETIASDANEKLRACVSSERDKDVESADVWAVSEREAGRKNISTNINARKVFQSLTANTKIWLDQKIVKNPDECCERKEKGVISINEQDSWADTNGDGEIDWLKLYGYDKEKMERKGDGFTTIRILNRVKGKWVDFTPDDFNEGS